ncbi:hypothetical protein N9112_00140 [bacterium]|nr:hypothetical protein [bacterium]
MSMKVKNIEKEFRRLRKEVDSELSIKAYARSLVLKAELQLNTPVDTGEAAGSWTILRTKDGALIRNTADHIEYLNEGSSKQAPAFFIERTALRYGTPVGVIVQPAPK